MFERSKKRVYVVVSSQIVIYIKYINSHNDYFKSEIYLEKFMDLIM